MWPGWPRTATRYVGTFVIRTNINTTQKSQFKVHMYAKFPHAENGASPPKRKRSIPSCSLFLVSQSKGLRSRRIWRRRPRCLRPCPASGAEIASLLRMGGDLPPPLRRQPRADGPIPLTLHFRFADINSRHKCSECVRRWNRECLGSISFGYSISFGAISFVSQSKGLKF